LVANAQAGFRKGFIVKNNGDTISGMVFYGIDGRFKQVCRFKRFEIIKGISYDPTEIRAFGFKNGRYFESKTTGKRKLFYECLIKGPVSLYRLPGMIHGQLYIDHASTGFIKLNKGINRTTSGENFDNFREFLSWLLVHSGLADDAVNSASYSAKSVAALIKDASSHTRMAVKSYNQTQGVHVLTDYSFSKPHSLWKMGLSGGYQFLKIQIPGNINTRYFGEAGFNTTYRPVTGVFINRKLSKKSDLAFAELSILYLADKYYGYAEYKTLSDCRDEIFLEFSGIQAPLSLKFQFKGQHVQTFIKAGVYGTFLLSSTYSRYAERKYGPEIFTDRYYDFRSRNDYGLLGGFGMEIPVGQVRRIILEAAYIRGRQLLTYSGGIYTESLDSKVISSGISITLCMNL
jgi:hypothetical protein